MTPIEQALDALKIARADYEAWGYGTIKVEAAIAALEAPQALTDEQIEKKCLDPSLSLVELIDLSEKTAFKAGLHYGKTAAHSPELQERMRAIDGAIRTAVALLAAQPEPEAKPVDLRAFDALGSEAWQAMCDAAYDRAAQSDQRAANALRSAMRSIITDALAAAQPLQAQPPEPYLCIKPACGPDCSGCNSALSPETVREYAALHAGLRLQAQPVAHVPIHPRNGPLWMETFAEGEDVSQRRSGSYPTMALYAATAPQEAQDYEAHQKNGLAWAIDCWTQEVKNRPMINVHRRTLDDAWRQVIRYFGGDPEKLIGPSHDALMAAAPVVQAVQATSEPPRRELQELLQAFRLSNWTDEIGDGLPLVDRVTSGETIGPGILQLELLADEICVLFADRASSDAAVQAAQVPAKAEVTAAEALEFYKYLRSGEGELFISGHGVDGYDPNYKGEDADIALRCTLRRVNAGKRIPASGEIGSV